MPARGDLTDTRGRYTPKGATTAPWEPFHVPPAIRYGVCFLDRVTARTWAPRPAWLDYLPQVWTRLENGSEYYVKRTWVLEQGTSGPVYREQAPAPFAPPSGKLPVKGVPGATRGTKRPRNAGPVESVEVHSDDEEAWTHVPDHEP